jgi:hypothetical protein
LCESTRSVAHQLLLFALLAPDAALGAPLSPRELHAVIAKMTSDPHCQPARRTRRTAALAQRTARAARDSITAICFTIPPTKR